MQEVPDANFKQPKKKIFINGQEVRVDTRGTTGECSFGDPAGSVRTNEWPTGGTLGSRKRTVVESPRVRPALVRDAFKQRRTSQPAGFLANTHHDWMNFSLQPPFALSRASPKMTKPEKFSLRAIRELTKDDAFRKCIISH